MRLRLLFIMSLLTLLLTVTFKAWPGTAVPFSADYVLGFLFVTPLVGALSAWTLTGFKGAGQLMTDGGRSLWALVLLLFVAWAWLSQSWALMRGSRDAIAQNAALTYALVAAFALLLVCCPPPRRQLNAALVAALLVSAAVGIAQSAAQSELGLHLLGEQRDLDPARSGVSVVQSGEARLLRAYGLLPHPNIMGGVLAAGAAWLLAHSAEPRGRGRRIGALAVVFLALCLTFSRGAWIALAVSSAFIVAWHAWRGKLRMLALPLLACSIVGLGFAATYHPFLLARANVTGEALEQRSVAERVIYNQIAFEAIQSAPLQGVGAGNFAWYAARYLRDHPEYDLRGTNVHQVALLILAELGLIGFALFGLIVTLPLLRGGWLLWQHGVDAQRLGALAGALILALVGVVDHYPAAIPQALLLWWGLLALAMQPHSSDYASAGA
ncbi:MAG: O-antigen ligase family protein [Anaerolinea sp.]